MENFVISWNNGICLYNTLSYIFEFMYNLTIHNISQKYQRIFTIENILFNEYMTGTNANERNEIFFSPTSETQKMYQAWHEHLCFLHLKTCICFVFNCSPVICFSFKLYMGFDNFFVIWFELIIEDLCFVFDVFNFQI